MKIILLNISDLNLENAMIAILGLIVVFIALSVLYLFFRTIPKLIDWQIRLQLKKKGKLIDSPKGKDIRIESGVDAAISAALYLYFGQIHDEENAIITIKKVSKTYSPWSSKIYSMRWPLR